MIDKLLNGMRKGACVISLAVALSGCGDRENVDGEEKLYSTHGYYGRILDNYRGFRVGIEKSKPESSVYRKAMRVYMPDTVFFDKRNKTEGWKTINENSVCVEDTNENGIFDSGDLISVDGYFVKIFPGVYDYKGIIATRTTRLEDSEFYEMIKVERRLYDDVLRYVNPDSLNSVYDAVFNSFMAKEIRQK